MLPLQLAEVSQRCTQYFSRGSSGPSEGVEGGGGGGEAECFLSETCEVYAFGSNSSSQLAMGSTEKFLKATVMPHMANIQLVRVCV